MSLQIVAQYNGTVFVVVDDNVEVTVSIEVGVNGATSVGLEVGTAIGGHVVEMALYLFVKDVPLIRVRKIGFSSVDNIEILLAIVVKVEEVRIPCPAAAFSTAVKIGVMSFLIPR